MGEFREKVEDFLQNGDRDMVAFLESFPRHQQPDVLRQLQHTAEKMAIERGDYEGLANIAEIGKGIDDFENAVIDELAQKQENENEIQRLRGQLQNSISEICDEIIRKVLEQGEDKDQWAAIAREMIHNFKEHKVYDEEDWKPILHLL